MESKEFWVGYRKHLRDFWGDLGFLRLLWFVLETGGMVVMEGGEGAAATPSHRMPAW